MEKIKTYVKEMVNKHQAIFEMLHDEFTFNNFGEFLSSYAEKQFKNELMLSFFNYLNTSIEEDNVSKEKLVEYLETTKKGYTQTRLQNNPVYLQQNRL